MLFRQSIVLISSTIFIFLDVIRVAVHGSQFKINLVHSMLGLVEALWVIIC